MNQQPDEEIYRMSSQTKELCPHGVWRKCSTSPTWKLSKPPPSGFFWRIHFVGVTDYLIGH